MRHQSSLAEINVTPLVDVMLVLLIISMLAAPMLQKGIELELPATETAVDIQDARVVISMDRDGRVFINDRPVHVELLPERMQQLAASRPDETIFLRAHKGLPYGDILTLMDTIRRAGLVHISLVTVPLENGEGV